MRRVALALGLLLVLVGLRLLPSCGSDQQTSSPAADPPPALAFDVDAGLGDSGAECAEETKDVFVLSEQQTLYSFHPPSLTFTEIGALKCAAGGSTPTSMAIDRKGTAWVRYFDGTLWKVRTQDLSCEKTTYVPPAAVDPFFQFGMSFSSTAKGDSTEQLFLSDAKGFGHGRLDQSTLKVTYLGPYTGALAKKRAELTGTGDGKLYGFFATKSNEATQIAEISKNNGAISTVNDLPSVKPGDAYAFSFYAGDFYVYTHTAFGGDGGGGSGGGADNGSDVTRFRPTDGSITVVKSGVGFKIVGAGVSTCAPTEGPR